MDVRAADAAVADLDEDLGRAGVRHRAVLDGHLTGGPVDGHRHHLGEAAHADAASGRPRPIMRATRTRWWAPEPNMAAVVFTRFTYMCMSCSHV